MGKAAIWFGGTAVVLLIGYATVPPSATNTWILVVLWWGFIFASALFFLTGSAYLIPIGRRHLNPLKILDDWRCTYWPKEKQLKVLLWFSDYSDSRDFKVSCIAQFGDQIVNVNDRIDLDGSFLHLGDSQIKHGGSRPRMLEFQKNNTQVDNASKAKVTVTIKPLGGIWITRKGEREIPVQVINH